MFDALADRLEDAWKKLRGQDKISSANIQDTLKEVRRALLEADVNLQVVKGFIAEVEKQALALKLFPELILASNLSKLSMMNWSKLWGKVTSP